MLIDASVFEMFLHFALIETTESQDCFRNAGEKQYKAVFKCVNL